MLITTTHKIRAVLAVAAATIVATVGLGYGQAHAAPGCTASGLSSALGQVASSTGVWLSAHPEAEAAVSNPPRSSRRCSSPSTVDSAARRACYDQPGPALPGGRAAAVRVRGPNLGEYADSLVAKA